MMGTAPGIRTSVTQAPDQSREEHTADRARHHAGDGDHRALAEDARQQMPWRRPNGESNAKLSRPGAHRERQHAGHADDGNCQRDAGESAKHERVQSIRRQHLGADVLQSRGPLDRLFRGEIADDLGNRRDECVWIGPCVHEEPSAADFLFHRVVDRHRRSWHDVLVVHVRDDTDNPARLAADVDELDDRIGPHQATVDGFLGREHPLSDALADDHDTLSRRDGRPR